MNSRNLIIIKTVIRGNKIKVNLRGTISRNLIIIKTIIIRRIKIKVNLRRIKTKVRRIIIIIIKI